MRSFLGVPIVASEGVIGAFYLTHKETAAAFGDGDQELIELLAAHAAIAITNASLYERSRELSVLSERNRLAVELHDAVSQKLFGIVLASESAATLMDRDDPEASTQLDRVRDLAGEALEELRALILELRAPDLRRDGLGGALRKHAEVQGRLRDAELALDIDDGLSVGAGTDHEVFRIAQEALHNALRHADAERVAVTLGRLDGDVVLEVRDEGVGFDPQGPEARSRRLGLTSMEERARRIGARLQIRSSPAAGTTVRLELPGG